VTGTPPEFNLEDLRGQIERLDGGAWRVERTLKRTPFGETQLVYRNGSEAGPFIRKLLANDSGQGDAYETIFRAQAAGMRFSHVPVIYDCTKTETGIAVVMEHVPGKTLREYVASVGPGDRAARFAAIALCEALDELHTALATPNIHRDIKPGNLMVSPVGITFIDLDITRSWHEGAEHDTTRFGTPGYAPPEQFGFGQTGVASDLFAAGMTLAFCCTGEDPTAQLRESGFADPRIPAWIRPVLVRATQFDPAARYRSASEMRDAAVTAMNARGQGGPSAPAASPTTAPTPDAMWDADERQRESMPADTPHSPIEVKTIFKYLWNALAVILCVYCAGAFTTGLTAGFSNLDVDLLTLIQRRPIAILGILEAIGFYLVTAIALYLMSFKVHLRRIAPFNRFTWRQELPAGIGIIALYSLVVYLTTHFLAA